MSFSTLRHRAALGAAATALTVMLPLGLSAVATDAASAATLSPTQSAIASLPDTPRTPKAIAKRMVLVKHDWSLKQWRCVHDLWNRESGWQVRAGNANGGPYGIPQAYPGYKMGTGWQDSARVQVRWGLSYIKGRYGKPCVANRHQLNRHWY